MIEEALSHTNGLLQLIWDKEDIEYINKVFILKVRKALSLYKKTQESWEANGFESAMEILKDTPPELGVFEMVSKWCALVRGIADASTNMTINALIDK